MRNILLIGAGKSSSSLIKYLLDHASRENWTLIVADFSEENARSKIMNHPSAQAVAFDIKNDSERKRLIAHSDIVISMLPANMHFPVAMECLLHKKNLITASYVSDEIKSLDKEAALSGVLFLNECGLDPGLDHMSAMEIIDKVHEQNGELKSFRSYTGGLVAPESNDNPWGYKFSWNPRNVILAGQGTARFIENGRYKYIPYNRLFTEIKKITVDGIGSFDGYANRDSLSYRSIYQLEKIPTMIRGTLRQEGFCNAWNIFVKLGLTDDSYVIENSENLTYRELVDAFIPASVHGVSVKEKLAAFTGVSVMSREMEMIAWTGILDDVKISIPKATPAQILQKLLEEKWKLKETDKDMIVMQHQFEYTINGKNIFHTSSLAVTGENSIYTAMAKTVGLPVAVAAKLILSNKIKLTGVQIPVSREFYMPILEELKKYEISFTEQVKT
jgi:saccharopine dehydrogenase (NADP+, L-glutamate forming)